MRENKQRKAEGDASEDVDAMTRWGVVRKSCEGDRSAQDFEKEYVGIEEGSKIETREWEKTT